MKARLGILIALLLVGSLIFPILNPTPALAATVGPSDAGTGADGGGGNASWTSPGNITVAGSPYATCTIPDRGIMSVYESNYLNATNYGFTLPSNVVIDGIQVAIRRQSSGSNDIRDDVVRLLKDGSRVGSNYDSSSYWPTSFGVANYGGTSDLWGTTWTYADINDSDFGVSLRAENQDWTYDRTATVDYIRITVTYHIPVYHTITATAGSNGTITPSGSVPVEEGTDQTFDITPDTGYIVADVAVDTVSQGRLNSYTFTNVTAAHAIGATFEDSWKEPSSYEDHGWNSEDDAYASDNDRASGGSGDEVEYRNFNIPAIPAGYTIDGIEVAVEGYTTGRQMDIRLSWNNGSSWTTGSGDKTTNMPSGSSNEATLIFGGDTDTWNRTWAYDEFPNDKFRVEFDTGSGGGSVYVDQLQVKVHSTPPTPLDFGDAPDSYGTLLASNGARHAPDTIRMGATIDYELNGQPSAGAVDDDLNGTIPDDEDGVTNLGPLMQGATAATVDVHGGPLGGKLDAWVDFNGNGVFDTSEHLWSSASQTLTPGDNEDLTFTVPLAAIPGTTYARFRLSTSGGLSPTGLASDGEVEDYTVVIEEITPLPNPPLDPCCGLDIILVLDSSDSISNLNDVRTPANAFVDALLPGTDSLIGVVEFDTDMVGDYLNLTDLVGDKDTPDSIKERIDDINQWGGIDNELTNWEAGLTVATWLLEYGGEDRDDTVYPDLIILFSDGEPTTYGYPSSLGSYNMGSEPETEDINGAIIAANAAKSSTGPIRVLYVGVDSTTTHGQKVSDDDPQPTPPDETTDFILASDTAGFGDLTVAVATQADQCGTIRAKKQTDPDGTSDLFDFTDTIESPNSFQLADDDMKTFENVLAGTYTITEGDPTPDFDLTGIQFSDGNSTGDLGALTATIRLEPNETVTCTFTNTQRGTIIVEKQTSPPGEGPFDFTDDIESPNSFQLNDLGTKTFNYVVPGTYTVTEEIPSGWGLDDIDFTETVSGDSSDNTSTGEATIVLQPGETVTCTFANSPFTPIIEEEKPEEEGEAVGIEVYPVNKFGLLMPWLVLAAVVIIGSGILVMRRRKTH